MKTLLINTVIEMPMEYADIWANVVGNYYQSVDKGEIGEWRKIPLNAECVKHLPLNKQFGFIDYEEAKHINELSPIYNN